MIKKRYLLIMIIICLLSISSANANDSQDNLLNCSNEPILNNNIQNDFNVLQSEISSKNENEIIFLDNDYSFVGGHNVIIAHDNVTIEGNGHIIDGNNLAGLIITGDNVILKKNWLI